MKTIVDTNIFLAVALDEPEKDTIIEVSEGFEPLSPEILPFEIGNALIAMYKRERLTHFELKKAIDIVELIPVRLVSVDIKKSLEIAAKFKIYAYDAYFIQSAISQSCQLFTLDKQMKRVAQQLNIKVVEF